MIEAIPMFDSDSEHNQEYRDRVEKIYSESLKPANITPDVVKEAFVWAWRGSQLGEIAETITGDDAYLGSLVGGIVRDYLYQEAVREADNETY